MSNYKEDLLSIGLKIILTNTAVKNIYSNILEYISNEIGKEHIETNSFNKKEEISYDLLKKILSPNKEYQSYLRNAGVGSEGDDLIDVIIATDSQGSVNKELLSYFPKKTIVLRGIQQAKGRDSNEFIVTNFSLLPENIGQDSVYSIPAFLSFYPKDIATYYGLGIPDDIVTKIKELPTSQEYYHLTNKRLEDWRRYLNIKEKLAEDKYFSLNYLGYKENLKEESLEFFIDKDQTFNEALLAKIKRSIGYPIYLNKAKSQDDEKIYNKGQIIGELIDFNKKNMRLRVRLNEEFLDRLNKISTRPPQSGVLEYKPIGDLTEIKRRKRGLEKFRQGQMANINLAKFIFDAKKSRLPSNDIKLDREALFIKTLNNRQLKAVENAINTKDLYLVKGPPGTGKTTVITEMCHQIVKQGKKVLLSSQSNLAVDNVIARLMEVPSVRALRLGSSVEKEGLAYTEDKVVKTWLKSSAKKAESKIEECRKSVDFTKRAREIKRRLVGYKKSLEKKKEAEDNLRKEEEWKRKLLKELNQINRDTDKYQEVINSLESIIDNFLQQDLAQKETKDLEELLAINDNYIKFIENLDSILKYLNKINESNMRPNLLKLDFNRIYEVAQKAYHLKATILKGYEEESKIYANIEEEINNISKIQQEFSNNKFEKLINKKEELTNKIEVLNERLSDEKLNYAKLQSYQESLKQRELDVDKWLDNISPTAIDLGMLDNLIDNLNNSLPVNLYRGEIDEELFKVIWSRSKGGVEKKLSVLRNNYENYDEFILAANQLEAIIDLNESFITKLRAKLLDQGYSQNALKSLLKPKVFSIQAENKLFDYIKRVDKSYWKGKKGAYIDLSVIGQSYLDSKDNKKLERAFENFSEFNFKVKKSYKKLKRNIKEQESLMTGLKLKVVEIIFEGLEGSSIEFIEKIEQDIDRVSAELISVKERRNFLNQEISKQSDLSTRLKEEINYSFTKIKRLLNNLPSNNEIFASLQIHTHSLLSSDLKDLTSFIRKWNKEYLEAKEIAKELRKSKFMNYLNDSLIEVKDKINNDLKDKSIKKEELSEEITIIEEKILTYNEELKEIKEKLSLDLNWWEKNFNQLDYFDQDIINRRLETDNLDSLSFINFIISKLEGVNRGYNANSSYINRFSDLVSSWKKKSKDISKVDEFALKEIYIKNVNVIGSTCSNTGAKRFIEEYDDFDYVIVDEISKATPPELILPLLKGKKLILIGDDKQLPPMIHANTLDELAEELKVDKKEVDHIKRSLFAELWKAADEENKTMLNIQYRMHPDIMAVINQFYGGELESGLENPNQDRKHEFKLPYISESNHNIWIDLPLSEYFYEEKLGTSYKNSAELQIIEKVVSDLDQEWAKKVAQGAEIKKVGLITFYSAQARLLSHRFLNNDNYPNLEFRVGTVDRFQGMERDIVIVSMVRNNPNNAIGFARSPERINVALSRAKELLVLVGSTQLFCHESSHSSATKIYSNIASIINSKGGIINVSKLGKGGL
ncbi:AAA domain-containing protein [Natroniella acetigena]|uniref:AAA domain-containing protein n=1 Tax=Natroniella acetigena TaxID=52004 RepID=UPI002009EF2A|nr:AAA domain-containing protein [Natroniella acetigena]MCK8827059.1 AAA domain-containing protein [Natroniella acetigena]